MDWVVLSLLLVFLWIDLWKYWGFMNGCILFSCSNGDILFYVKIWIRYWFRIFIVFFNSWFIEIIFLVVIMCILVWLVIVLIMFIIIGVWELRNGWLEGIGLMKFLNSCYRFLILMRILKWMIYFNWFLFVYVFFFVVVGRERWDLDIGIWNV